MPRKKIHTTKHQLVAISSTWPKTAFLSTQGLKSRLKGDWQCTDWHQTDFGFSSFWDLDFAPGSVWGSSDSSGEAQWAVTQVRSQLSLQQYCDELLTSGNKGADDAPPPWGHQGGTGQPPPETAPPPSNNASAPTNAVKQNHSRCWRTPPHKRAFFLLAMKDEENQDHEAQTPLLWPLKRCTVYKRQTKMDRAIDLSLPLIQFSPLSQCTIIALVMRLTLKFFSLMVKSRSVHPSPIIAILRQWTLLRHLIRQIVICIVHFLWLSVIQHLKDSIQTILLSHRHLKKRILLLEKETMTPPIIGESKR